MRTANVEIEIEIEGDIFDATVYYEISGVHHAETPTSPEEFPEIEISELTLKSGLDLTELLENETVSGKINVLVKEALEE